jgi:hypothetical protein
VEGLEHLEAGLVARARARLAEPAAVTDVNVVEVVVQ